MQSFKEIISGVKFEPQNGQDIDFDKVRTVTIVKEDVGNGDRLVLTAQYDNGTRFEVVGKHQQRKAEVRTEAKAAAKAEPVTIVGHAQLKQGEAVVATAAPTASTPGAIKQTTPGGAK